MPHRESFVGYSGSTIPTAGQAIFDQGPKHRTTITTGSPRRNRRKSNGVPVDAQGRIDLASLAAQRLNFLDQYNQQVADLNHNYNTQVMRAQQNEPYVQRSILSDYAGRGMGFSSGYGQATGRETQLYNQNLGDLAYQHTYGLRDLGTQRSDMRRSLDVQQQAIRQAAADRMAAQAGSLGLSNGRRQNAQQISRGLGIRHPRRHNQQGAY